MPLLNIQADAHPEGNRIDLRWEYPETAGLDGVRVVRNTDRYPVHPDDGIVIEDDAGLTEVNDNGLAAERAYYYGLFPYQGTPPVYEFDNKNRVFAVATGLHDFAGYMQRLLPAVYHRYDIDTEFLKRFLEITGGQLDQFYSLARFNQSLQNVKDTPGILLPLLAEWIGWRTDFKRGLDEQREEIRNAPAVYKTIGLIPTLEATVKRISGWETRSKEFVHNILAANKPERLNLWYMQRDGGGIWSEQEQLLSVDFAYDGRPSFVIDNNQVQRLFYHTLRKGRWELWYKTSPAYTLTTDLSSELQAGVISAVLLEAINALGLTLSQTSLLANLSANIWEITDAAERYVIEIHTDGLRVHHVSAPAGEMSESRPLIVNSFINKHPAAAQQDDRLWLFWSIYDQAAGSWGIRYRFHSDAVWSATGPADDWMIDLSDNPFADGGAYDPEIQRRHPVTALDDSNRLWLFWQEQIAGQWQLRYNRREAGSWGTAVTLPLDAGNDPRIRDEFSILMTASEIYIFWSRLADTSTPDQQRWQIAVRVKQNLDLDSTAWSVIHQLPKAADDNHHDREPYAVFNAGDLEVFWSSNREDSGWSVWHSILTDLNTDSWTSAERITGGVYSQHAPLPILSGAGIRLLYRASRHIVYNSDVYRATETYDERYAGALTPDTRHQQRIVLSESFEDPQRYTYDTGRNGVRDDSNRIARDTVGAYLDNDTLNDDEIEQGIQRLRPVMSEFLPATDRAVFIPRRNLHTEYVYGYDTASTPYINSSYTDDFVSVLNADALEPGTDFSDSLS